MSPVLEAAGVFDKSNGGCARLKGGTVERFCFCMDEEGGKILLEKCKQLSPVRCHWKSDSKSRRQEFIAHVATEFHNMSLYAEKFQ